MKVLVVYGGSSNEREISIKSGEAVVEALNNTEHEVTSYDPIKGINELERLIDSNDVVLPILHGKFGEDGQIQKILERHKAKYLGADSKSSENSFDKSKSHKILEGNGIKMPKFEIVNKNSFNSSALISKPFVLKPISGGSSLKTIIAHKIDGSILDECRAILDKEMLLEELIYGIEITVPILDKKVLPPIQIIPPENEEFDYENKYNGRSQEICPIPEKTIPLNIQENAKKIAMKVHKILNVRHLSRTDIIINDNGDLFVLELNTMPGMTKNSLYPIAAESAGYSMTELCNIFVNLAVGE